MILNRIIGTINTYSMLEGCKNVTVALSGGADSVCLLYVMKNVCESRCINLSAVHINHCIRGVESDRDENFCRSLCEKLKVPLVVRRENVPEYSKSHHLSLEEAAREIRYKAFGEISGNDHKIATAHTSSDNAETVLINLTRGTGLKGLTGIPPVRDNIIRPLIELTRQDVEAYLEGIGADFVTDSTNLTLDYTRNKIRHTVIPELNKINESFFKTISRETRILSEENQYIENQADDIFRSCIAEDNSLTGLEKYPRVPVKRCVMKFLKLWNIPINQDRINKVTDLIYEGGKINVSKNTFAVCKNNKLFITSGTKTQSELSVSLKFGENRLFPSKTLTLNNDNSGGIAFDADKVCGEMVLRNRRFGDKIKLSGREFTSSVKKLINENIAEAERPFIHFIEDDEGLIFVEHFGVADRVKVTGETRRIISVCINKN